MQSYILRNQRLQQFRAKIIQWIEFLAPLDLHCASTDLLDLGTQNANSCDLSYLLRVLSEHCPYDQHTGKHFYASLILRRRRKLAVLTVTVNHIALRITFEGHQTEANKFVIHETILDVDCD